jgi:16S rRNA (guanine1516-N2)-methyltransferase
MYPERKKSAKIKKEMQILQQLVGYSADEGELLDLAIKAAKHRVVVKRPKGSEPLKQLTPNYIVSSPNTRYDVYVR